MRRTEGRRTHYAWALAERGRRGLRESIQEKERENNTRKGRRRKKGKGTSRQNKSVRVANTRKSLSKGILERGYQERKRKGETRNKPELREDSSGGGTISLQEICGKAKGCESREGSVGKTAGSVKTK